MPFLSHFHLFPFDAVWSIPSADPFSPLKFSFSPFPSDSLYGKREVFADETRFDNVSDFWGFPVVRSQTACLPRTSLLRTSTSPQNRVIKRGQTSVLRPTYHLFSSSLEFYTGWDKRRCLPPMKCRVFLRLQSVCTGRLFRVEGLTWSPSFYSPTPPQTHPPPTPTHHTPPPPPPKSLPTF